MCLKLPQPMGSLGTLRIYGEDWKMMMTVLAPTFAGLILKITKSVEGCLEGGKGAKSVFCILLCLQGGIIEGFGVQEISVSQGVGELACRIVLRGMLASNLNE